MDLFNEYMVRRRKSGQDWALVSAMAVGAMVLTLAVLMLGQFLGSFTLAVEAGLLYLLYIGVTSMNVEFEYSVTNGDLDVDKISARRKRTRVVSVHARNFEYFAPKTAEHMRAFEDASIKARVDATSNTGGKGVYFAVYYRNDVKTCLAFEPTQKMLDDFARHVPRRVFFAE
ncbi:hypothetical protein FACS189492_2460 [Clostridia bacterium]|nr:hypothetical protein FACS189492_2460 [Clostridia bacterium]